jgi:phosphohistidine phosphatase
MKRLFVVRHAKSSWDDPTLPDFDRPLNSRGRENAPRMGGRLLARGVRPTAMLTSPALRALSTCEIIAQKLGFPTGLIQTNRALYHASPETIKQVLRKLPDSEDEPETLFVFGHNPGLTDFVNLLLNEAIDNVPTCGVVEAQLDINRWRELTWGGGRLADFDFPKKHPD